MSAMKLQKLVYYCQAWAMVLLRRPLFAEKFQAWAHGPVVYELFALHRGHFVVGKWPTGDAAALDGEAVRIIDGVVVHYGAMAAEILSDLTHAEKPWKEARAGLPEGHRSEAEIPTEALREFYSQQPRPPSLS
jgi:uncharacterized phage-associated protein